MGRDGGIASREGASDPRSTEVTIPDDLSGQRLDRALAILVPELARARIQRLIRDGDVLVEGIPAGKPSVTVETGARVVLHLPRDEPSDEPHAQALDLEVLHEDEDLVVINKPAGLVVHAGAGYHGATLVNGLLHLYGDSLSCRGGDERPGIVHRLDKGTSGVIAIARNDEAHDALTAQFAARTVQKEYAAIVYGCPDREEGRVDVPLGRDRSDRTKISANTDRPRDARTRWHRVEDLSGFAWLRVWPETGRMHQIRAHLAYVHHPCMGDERYAGARWKNEPDPGRRKAVRNFARPALHAHRLRLIHPRSGERVEFVAPLPDDLVELRSVLRGAREEPC